MRHPRERCPARPPSTHISNEKGGQFIRLFHIEPRRSIISSIFIDANVAPAVYSTKGVLTPRIWDTKGEWKLLYGSHILSSSPSEWQVLLCLGEGDQRKLFWKFSETERKHEELMEKLETQAVNSYKCSSCHCTGRRTSWKPAWQVCVDKSTRFHQHTDSSIALTHWKLGTRIQTSKENFLRVKLAGTHKLCYNATINTQS